MGQQAAPFDLTQSEIEYLRLVVDGHADNQIANQLFISRRTVSTHTSHIFAKLSVSGRTEAAAVAIRNDLV